MPASQEVAEEVLSRFSVSAYQRTRIWIEYQGGQRSTTERAIDVYGLIYRTGCWYSVAYCHLREDVRVFRLDRVKRVRLLDETFTMPPDFDPLTYLVNSFATIPGMWYVEVLFKATLEQAQHRVSPEVGILEETPDGILLRCYADGLDWMSYYLISTRLHFTVLRPPELRDRLREIANLVHEMAGVETFA
jgi:predicted DNA-binding transcriptional regulator YafY